MRSIVLGLVAIGGPNCARAAASVIALRYDGDYAGANVLQTDLRLTQTDEGYILRAGIATVGVWSHLLRGRSDIIAQGVWVGDSAAPSHVDSEAYWNGAPRRMIVDYVAGVPVIRVMQPPDAARRHALDRDDIAGTVDGLGLVVGLIRKIARTGRCDAHERVFDGHGVTDFRMQTGPMVVLPQAAAPYAGPALRCDFSTRKVAGLDADDDPRRADRGYALFAAPAAGLPRLPVRIVFQTRWLGDAVLALTSAHTE